MVKTYADAVKQNLTPVEEPVNSGSWVSEVYDPENERRALRLAKWMEENYPISKEEKLAHQCDLFNTDYSFESTWGERDC